MATNAMVDACALENVHPNKTPSYHCFAVSSSENWFVTAGGSGFGLRTYMLVLILIFPSYVSPLTDPLPYLQKYHEYILLGPISGSRTYLFGFQFQFYLL